MATRDQIQWLIFGLAGGIFGNIVITAAWDIAIRGYNVINFTWYIIGLIFITGLFGFAIYQIKGSKEKEKLE